ncbi:uncharacterized protein LOC109537501 isoform X1 [Dendroctonus ponderosae]|uniref:uncharacterized protein LOC109537501 isoform X1 n=1 Tax=Dendroctonus ponderosae TaxID=77166 RepID=UPI002035B45C|nr:uncharacterized protein LOC109537501 isoform X1 [Dendroctonus ponderosae]
MFLWIVATLMIFVQSVISGYIEKVIVSGCETCQLMLSCRQLDSIIAILDVDFNSTEAGLAKKIHGTFPPDHPRDALNKRCSGLNYCSFILSEDSPGSEALGAGNLTIKYACVTRDRVNPYCNTKIQLNELRSSGIIHNPGYPRFYAGKRDCIWKIFATPYQKVKLKILDIALFDTRVLLQEDCKDTLEIKDSGQTIFSTCSQNDPPSEVISATESVEVVLTSRQLINPRRGVLIYYSSVGCLPVPAPKQAFLVFQNQSVASYSCCKGYVFPDTQTENRTIKCYGDSWNVSLPLLDCEKPEVSQAILLQNSVKLVETMASDLLAPILLMIILFALNGIVIFYIHKARKNDFRRRGSSNFDIPSQRRLYYGSIGNDTSSLRGKQLKSSMKNWALSLKLSNERLP